MSCYCGIGESYFSCCFLLHTGKKTAKTAEELMRSRYSAFVVKDLSYLKKTMKSTAKADFSISKNRTWLKNIIWKGLQVHDHELGQVIHDEGWVTFTASYLENKERFLGKRPLDDNQTPEAKRKYQNPLY